MAQAGTPVNVLTYSQRTNNTASQVDTGTVEFSNDGTIWGTPIGIKFGYHGQNGAKQLVTLPAGQNGRYIRLTMLKNLYFAQNPAADTTGASGATAMATSLAEFGADYNQDPRLYWTVTASSDDGSNPANNLVDGSVSTMWQSNWSKPDVYPYTLTFDMGSTQLFNQITYNTWANGQNFNSAADSGTVLFSNDGINWTTDSIPIKFKYDQNLIDTFNLPATKNYRYFRLVIWQNHWVSVNGQGTTSTDYATSLTEVGTHYDQSLPVHLATPFAAKSMNNTVQLSWVTATELNNGHFNINRSTDGVNFSLLTTVPAANQPHSYSYIDQSPANGTNYYQLVQYDLDGRATNYGIVSAAVAAATNSNTLTIGRVTANSINIRIDANNAGNATVQLYNMAGQLLASQPVTLNKGVNKANITIQGNTGVYIVTVNINGQKETKKFFKP